MLVKDLLPTGPGYTKGDYTDTALMALGEEMCNYKLE